MAVARARSAVAGARSAVARDRPSPGPDGAPIGFRPRPRPSPAACLNDPVWLFTVEVSLAGQAPFPAVFGHRVPLPKVAMVAPGVKLAVAVDPSNPGQEVAIDWDKSPIA